MSLNVKHSFKVEQHYNVDIDFAKTDSTSQSVQINSHYALFLLLKLLVF